VSLALGGYRTATALLEPLAPAVLKARLKRGKEDPARWGERLGRAGAARPHGPLIWFHGASVGESLSLLPLVERLRTERPDAGALVTSGTVTSAELLARRLPPGAIHQYVPVDAPGAVRRFLAHWGPDAAVFVESELWPNLLLGAKASGAKLALLSARVGDDSARGWARAGGAARSLFSAFDLVMAQDDATAAKLSALGARDDGRVNLKYAGDPLPADRAELDALRAAYAGRPVLLAASTHPGEEAQALDAFAPLADRAALVIVPRHPARGAEAAALIRSRGSPAGLRSAGDPAGPDTTYVADTLGELGLWLRLCRAVYVGGGLVEGVGGHNPLEPARLDRPAATGPHVHNWREVYAALCAAGGITVVRDAGELADFFRRAADGDPALCAQAEHARLFAAAQNGAVEAAFARLKALLP